MIDLDFSSQDKIKYASIDFDVEIIAFPFVEFGGGDIDSYVEISVLASDSFVTFASKFDIWTIFDSCWDFYFDDFSLFLQSTIFQILSIFSKNFPCSSASRAGTLCLHDAEWCVGLLGNYSVSAAGSTCFFLYSLHFYQSIVSDFFGGT